MSIPNITASNFSAPTQNVFQQRRQDFSQLAQSLQAGDLTGAQQAYSALQNLLPSNQSGSATGNNPLQNDFAALGQALAAGNLSQAQSAFSQLQSDLKSALQNGSTQGQASGIAGPHRGHHGHHHHGSAVENSSSSSTTDTTDTTGQTDTTNGSVNLTA